MLDRLAEAKLWIQKWWFLISSIIIAILYYAFVNRSKAISDLTQQIQLDKLGKELDNLNKESEKSDAKAQESSKKYTDLKRRHPELVARLGLRKPS